MNRNYPKGKSHFYQFKNRIDKNGTVTTDRWGSLRFKKAMYKLFISLIASTTITATALAQSFSTFSAGVPELNLGNKILLEKEADAIRYPISQAIGRSIFGEKDGEQYAIGKVTLSKAVVIIYYTKPAGVAPLGKIVATSFSNSGKKVSSEAIGVFADFAGMHFRITISGSSQEKGAVAVTTNVEAIKDNGDVNQDMSKISIYYFSAKGKISKM